MMNMENPFENVFLAFSFSLFNFPVVFFFFSLFISRASLGAFELLSEIMHSFDELENYGNLLSSKIYSILIFDRLSTEFYVFFFLFARPTISLNNFL